MVEVKHTQSKIKNNPAEYVTIGMIQAIRRAEWVEELDRRLCPPTAEEIKRKQEETTLKLRKGGIAL